MITKEKAISIAKEYLEGKKEIFSNLQVFYRDKDSLVYPIPFGKFKGEKINFYSVSYGQIWGIEERAMGMDIDAETGEILFLTTPHQFLEP